MGNRAQTSWEADLLRGVREAVSGEGRWGELLEDGRRGVHLAVVREPYLSMVLVGVKTVEARVSAARREPWGRVGEGDVVLLKRVSGPVVGVAEVGRVWACEIESGEKLRELREAFEGRVRGGDVFWEGCAGARYVTLLEVAGVVAVGAVACGKRDRRGWVVLRETGGVGAGAQGARGGAGGW